MYDADSSDEDLYNDNTVEEKDLELDFDLDQLTVPRILRDYENDEPVFSSPMCRSSGDSRNWHRSAWCQTTYAKIKIDISRSRSSERWTSSDWSSINEGLSTKRLLGQEKKLPDEIKVLSHQKNILRVHMQNFNNESKKRVMY